MSAIFLHRLADCEACLALLAQTLPGSGQRIISVVRDAARQPEYLVRAVDAPFDLRLKLKDRGYRWRPPELTNGSVWWTTTSDPEGEIAWLQAEVYDAPIDIPVHEVTALTRYSDRLWSFDP